MHVVWSYCQAAGLVAKRKTNQLEQFKKEESAGAQKKNKCKAKNSAPSLFAVRITLGVFKV